MKVYYVVLRIEAGQARVEARLSRGFVDTS